MQNFWKRYNKVLLDKLALDREKYILQDENTKLKMLLKQYLDGKCPCPQSLTNGVRSRRKARFVNCTFQEMNLCMPALK